MNPLLTVALLGLSAEGLVICPFFAFSLTLTDRSAGIRFITGRIVGLLCFGAVISLLGHRLPVPERWVNVFFGAMILTLGIFRLVSASRGPAGSGNPGKCRHGGSGKKIGFGLGLFRGFLNPGRKFIYLAPLLIGAGLLNGLALSFAFAVTSSLYLFLGFFSAGLLSKLIPYKRHIGTIGAAALVVLGVLYGWRGIGA